MGSRSDGGENEGLSVAQAGVGWPIRLPRMVGKPFAASALRRLQKRQTSKGSHEGKIADLAQYLREPLICFDATGIAAGGSHRLWSETELVRPIARRIIWLRLVVAADTGNSASHSS